MPSGFRAGRFGQRAPVGCGGALPTSAGAAHSRRAADPTEALDSRSFEPFSHPQRIGRSLSQNRPIRFHLNSEPRHTECVFQQRFPAFVNRAARPAFQTLEQFEVVAAPADSYKPCCD